MIQNLNQMSFTSFGTILPERAPSSGSQPVNSRESLSLDNRNPPIYQAVSPTWITTAMGMTVLSVSKDGENFLHFYLDKTVCIHSGVYFFLAPFRQACANAFWWFETPPRVTGQFCKINDFRVSHSILVTNVYTFFYQEKEKGFFFSGESHPMLELTYVDKGSLHSVADGQDLLLSQGDLVIYGPDQWHMQYADIDVITSFVTITFDVEGGDWQALTNRICKPNRHAVGILQSLLKEQDNQDSYSGDTILSLLTLLLLTILRFSAAPAARLQSTNSIQSENEMIRRAQQYISTHIREKLSVPKVAQMVDISPSYMTALFHNNLQISPGEYIRRIKLQESKQMIREGNLNFTEIAAALQYSTVHHFSRQFKEKFGITPSEYAKSVR